MKFPIFFIFTMLFVHAQADLKSSAAQIKSWSQAEKWDEDLTWRKLLHFEPTTFGGLESQVDGDDFFFSPQGKKDRKAELEATIEAFFSQELQASDQDEKKVPMCRYPARFSWLKKKVGSRSIDWPVRQCPRFEKFKKTLIGPGVSLIFSSYYLNNPSSAFGHTFLRINKAPAENGKRYELLDYGLNYAANRDTDNGLVYAFKGLFGMFSGTFTTTPFYYKVREYSNAESRDLWDYELNISPETVDHLIEHVWELGPTLINYWYLSENCSYHMFSILEAADSKIDLLSRLKTFVIPSDTVQVLWQVPGLVKAVHFRPSIRTELLTRARDLTSDEVDLVVKTIKLKKVPDEISQQSLKSQVRILDTTVDYIDFKYSYEIQVEGAEILKFKGQVLNRRSQIDLISEPVKVDLPTLEKPHEAHGSRRLGAGYLMVKENASRYLLDYKFALHDQLDPIQGYPEYAQITFFNFQASYVEVTRTLALEDWTLFEVRSNTPFSNLQNDLSWNFRVATERVRNENCDYCRWSGVTGGAGGTWSLGSSPYALLSLGVKGISGLHSENSTQIWLGAGPEVRLRIRWSPYVISMFEAWERLDLQGSERVYFQRGLSHQYSFSKANGVRVGYMDYGFDKAGSVQLFSYY